MDNIRLPETVKNPNARPPKGLSGEKLMDWYLGNKTQKLRDGGCWIWQGRSVSGTPTISYKNKKASVCRLIVESRYRALAPWEKVKRKCGNSFCVNPDHFKLIGVR